MPGLYAIGAVSYLSAVGVTASLLFHSHFDEVTSLYGVIMAVGCAVAISGRNAGRPLIVYGQVLAVDGGYTAV